MSDLRSKLRDASSANRINAIEDSFRGSKFAQSNHKVDWLGYDSKGRGLVKSRGRVYAAGNLSKTSPTPKARILMRTGKGIKTVTN